MKDSSRVRRQPEETRNGAQSASQYGRLAVAVIGAALAVVLVVVCLTPPDDPPLQRTQPTVLATGNVSTIELPVAPVEAATEEMRSELLELGALLTAQFPDDPDALQVVALLYADLQKTAEAEQLFRKGIELAPRQVGAYVGLASAAMAQGKDEDAVATLRQAQAAGCSTAEVSRLLATALEKLGKLEEAEKAIEEGLRTFGPSPQAAFQLGQIQIQLGQFAEAETSLRSAVSGGLASESAFFALSTACARQGKEEEAAKYRQRFSELKAQQQSAGNQRFQERYDLALRQIAVASLVRAATVFDVQKQPTDAERLLLRACALAPHSALVLGELGMFLRRQGRIADAQIVMHRLVEIEPQVIPHQVNLASLSAQLGEHDLAETTLKRVVAMRPDLSIGYSGLAHLYLKTGNAEQARWFAEAALKQQSTGADESVGICLVLAAACDQMNDRARAEEALAQARQLSPADPRLQQVRLYSPSPQKRTSFDVPATQR
jgi:tetratricopeptide (TPR) repeat protein